MVSKKFMFSAIAMMAFSVSSMGNTIFIDENINTIVVEEMEIQEDISSERCFLRGIATYYQALVAEYSEEESINYMNISVAICEGWSLEDVNL